MVKLDVVRSANAALADQITPFVAVVAGGTAGIGKFTVNAIAATFAGREGGNGFVRVHIVGRNEDAASKIIAECEAMCPGGKFRFHKGDLSLLKEVDRVCADITQMEQREARASGVQAKGVCRDVESSGSTYARSKGTRIARYIEVSRWIL